MEQLESPIELVKWGHNGENQSKLPVPVPLSISNKSINVSSPMTDRQELLSTFNSLLQPERFTDYGPNGLQVEGKVQIRKIVSGVTASRALIEAAVEAKADAIFPAPKKPIAHQNKPTQANPVPLEPKVDEPQVAPTLIEPQPEPAPPSEKPGELFSLVK